MALFSPSPPSSAVLPKVRSVENNATAQTPIFFFLPLNAQHFQPAARPQLPHTQRALITPTFK